MSSFQFGWKGWLLVMELLVVMSQRYVFISPSFFVGRSSSSSHSVINFVRMGSKVSGNRSRVDPGLEMRWSGVIGEMAIMEDTGWRCYSTISSWRDLVSSLFLSCTTQIWLAPSHPPSPDSHSIRSIQLLPLKSKHPSPSFAIRPRSHLHNWLRSPSFLERHYSLYPPYSLPCTPI